MLKYAIKMLLGDRAKFLSILIGLIFATFIITQQTGIFIGLMQRTYGFLTDTSIPDIWVMDKGVKYIDDNKLISDSYIFNVRSIEGVEWAVPMFKGLLSARRTNGQYQTCNVIGIDDATLIGGPPVMVEGEVTNLRFPDGVIVNDIGAEKKLGSPPEPGKKVIPLKMGDSLELNDRRAKVVGICQVTRTFLSYPVLYTTFSRAINFAPSERNFLSFILVKAGKGVDIQQLSKDIEDKTGLKALTTAQFKQRTLSYFMFQTGLLINFGFAVFLGVIIGIAISGQTFYSFAKDNRKLFAALKAVGATNRLLSKMIFVQACVAAILSWGIGIGISTLFGWSGGGTELSFNLPWWLFLGSGVAILFITILAAQISLYTIVKLEPGVVFQS